METTFVEQEEKNETQLSWVVKLSEISKPLTITEFNRHHYCYIPLMDPDNNETGYYGVFYKDLESSEPKWISSSGLLSAQYTIGVSEKIAEALKKEVELNTEIVSGAPFLLGYYAETNKTDIEIFEDDCSRTVFQLISSIDAETMESMNASVSLGFINSYNGTQSITINYLLNMTNKNGINGSKYQDYFLLSRFGHKFDHRSSSLGAVSTELHKIQEYYDISVNTFKQTTENVAGVKIDDFASMVSKKFKKAETGVFNAHWEMIPIEYKNLLSLLIITSSVLNSNYTPTVHSQLNRVIVPAISLVMKPVLEKKIT